MAMYCLDMLTIALELAVEDPVYEEMACKLYEHFVYIAAAMDELLSRVVYGGLMRRLVPPGAHP
jgi:hypothetical protein